MESIVRNSDAFLPIASFRFKLKVTTPLKLPPYKGGVFRGAFGSVFRKVVCAVPENDCPGCTFSLDCLYKTLFFPDPPAGFADAAKFSQPPRPYVLNPPETRKQSFRPGESLVFGVVLFGPSIEALPYFVYTFQRLGDLGLGPQRGKYCLTKAEALVNGDAICIYEKESQRLLSDYSLVSHDLTAPKKPVEELTLRFISPVRIKVKGRLVSNLDFSVLFDRLSQRMQLLSAFYGKPQALPDLSPLRDKSFQIQTTHHDLSWFEWDRHSGRQKSFMRFGGLTGTITYKGDLTLFLPYLVAGQLLNVGQATTFGLGRYQIET